MPFRVIDLLSEYQNYLIKLTTVEGEILFEGSYDNISYPEFQKEVFSYGVDTMKKINRVFTL